MNVYSFTSESFQTSCDITRVIYCTYYAYKYIFLNIYKKTKETAKIKQC